MALSGAHSIPEEAIHCNIRRWLGTGGSRFSAQAVHLSVSVSARVGAVGEKGVTSLDTQPQ